MKFEQPDTIDVILTQSELRTVTNMRAILDTCIDVFERGGYDHISDGDFYVTLNSLRDCRDIIYDFYECVGAEATDNE